MERTIALEGCLNFRDIGGYPTHDGRTVAWRLLFRSDALHHLTPGDVARLHDEIGLGVVVDLRSSGELAGDGRGLLGGEPLAFHHLPLFDGNTGDAGAAAEIDLADRYYLLARFAADPIASVLTTLAGADAPAVYHCAAGKDRTGVISALLLGLLGVPDEVIVADYAASRENLDAIVERLMANEGYQEMLAALPPDTLHAEPATMIRLLERIAAAHGDVAGYARDIGVTDDVVARLRQRLLG